ncbi:unnamed protein product, partial [Aureobasidium pullulans]
KAFDGRLLEATTSEVFINDISFDVKELRTRITDELAYVCYEIDFSLEREVITLIVDNIPESMPLHRLLAKAVARLLFLLSSTSQVAVAAQCAGLRYYPSTQLSFPNIPHLVLGAGLRQHFCTLPYFAIISLPLPNHSSIYPLFYANHALREDSSVSVGLVIFPSPGPAFSCPFARSVRYIAIPILTMVSQQAQLFSVVVRVHEVTSTTFIVSRQRLCRVSKFFDKAFSGSFLESHTGTLDLYEVPTYYFGLFLEWVTTGQLPALSLQHMVQLYILGDKYDTPELRQHITDSLTNYCFGPKFKHPLVTSLKSLLANAVVRVAYFNPVSLSRSEFSEMVDELLEKPYGVCDSCYNQKLFDHTQGDHCEHFDSEPADWKPERYHEEAIAARK